MASTIVTKNSSTASAVPVSGDLTQGELAVNVTDKKLYTKDSGGTVVKLVGGLGNQEANAVAITGGSVNGTTIGATTASTGAFTTLSASSTVSGTGFSTYLASPPAIGGTTAAAGSFTTLSASGNTTLSGGTANGVAYLNGSKVVTTGTALTFDGTALRVKNNGAYNPFFAVINASSTNDIASILYDQGTDIWKFINPSSYAGSGIDFCTGASNLTRYHIDTGGTSIWSVAGSEQMRLTSTGLGIGTSSPAVKLDVRRSGVGDVAYFFNGSDLTTAVVLGAGSDAGYIDTGSIAKLAFRLSGTEVMRLQSGNLGLGVTPSAWATVTPVFQVNRASFYGYSNEARMSANYYYNAGEKYIASDYATSYSQSNGKHQWYTAPSGTAGNAITFTQAMTLDASGQLLLGATSNLGTNRRELVLQSANGSILNLGTNGAADSFQLVCDTGPNALIINKSNTPMIFYTNNTERARIDSSGNLLVGTTSATIGAVTCAVALDATTVNSGFGMGINGNASNTQVMRFAYAGTAVGSISITSSTTAYNTSSDYRLKDNQQPLTGSGAFIDALKPKTWEWKADGSKGVGFIAHEVQEVSPGSVIGAKDAVDEEGNPIMQAMEYGSAEFIANIVAELQSLRQRVAQLEGK